MNFRYEFQSIIIFRKIYVRKQWLLLIDKILFYIRNQTMINDDDAQGNETVEIVIHETECSALFYT